MRQFRYILSLDAKFVIYDYQRGEISRGCTATVNSQAQYFLHPGMLILILTPSPCLEFCLFFFLDESLFRQNYEEAKDVLLARLASFQMEGTGWVLARVRRFRLKFSPYRPRAGAGGSYIPTPSWIQALRKSCLVNVANDDGKCFLYAILAHMYSEADSDWPNFRVERYHPYLSQLNTAGFSFPIHLKDIP